METIVKIKWDKPKEQAWLCDLNIQQALRKYCTNTKFEVKDLKELTGSEAIYGFCAWLSGREEKTIFSSKSNCTPIADLIKEFCETNNLIDPRDNWTDNLIHPE